MLGWAGVWGSKGREGDGGGGDQSSEATDRYKSFYCVAKLRHTIQSLNEPIKDVECNPLTRINKLLPFGLESLFGFRQCR